MRISPVKECLETQSQTLVHENFDQNTKKYILKATQ